MTIHLNNMQPEIYEFVYEWGALLSAFVCLPMGFAYGFVYGGGVKSRRMPAYVLLLGVQVGCAAMLAQFGHPHGRSISLGHILTAFILGIITPSLAGIGLCAWTDPRFCRELLNRNSVALKQQS
jgi:hypothetical protein